MLNGRFWSYWARWSEWIYEDERFERFERERVAYMLDMWQFEPIGDKKLR